MKVDSTDRELRNARKNGVDRAWATEKKAVFEGKGSRDWTVDQQKELIEKNSISHYEGHHMRSVAYGQTREEQLQIAKNGDNIQFLEKSENKNEHLKAHGGDYHNPTNGYYDVKTEKMHTFGKGQPRPPEKKELSNPIVKQKKEQYDEYGIKIQDKEQRNNKSHTQNQTRKHS